MMTPYRIIEVSNGPQETTWHVVRAMSADGRALEDISSHRSKAEAVIAKEDHEQLDAGG